MSVDATIALKAALVLAVGAVSFAAGWYRGEVKYTKQIEADRAAVTAMAEEARSKEHEQQQAVADALAARDEALGGTLALRDELERVRGESSELADRLESMSRASAASGECDAGRLGNCEHLLSGCAELLSEGLGLAQRGAGLSAKIAADKKVMAAAMKGVAQ